MKIKIGTVSYDIIEEGNGENVRIPKNKNKDIIMGLCDQVERKIYIHKDLSPSLKYKTLYHEITHAYIAEYVPKNGDLFMDEEEVCEFVAMYAPAIMASVKDYAFKSNKINVSGGN